MQYYALLHCDSLGTHTHTHTPWNLSLLLYRCILSIVLSIDMNEHWSENNPACFYSDVFYSTRCRYYFDYKHAASEFEKKFTSPCLIRSMVRARACMHAYLHQKPFQIFTLWKNKQKNISLCLRRKTFASLKSISFLQIRIDVSTLPSFL